MGSVSGRFGMVEKDLCGDAFSAGPAHSVGGGAKGDGTGGKVLSLDSDQALLNGTPPLGAGCDASLSCATSRGVADFTAPPGVSHLVNGAEADSWLFVFPFRVLTMSVPVS